MDILKGIGQENEINWFNLFSACFGKMMAIQSSCSKIVIKDQDWDIDFELKTISFGDDRYPIQFIGSEDLSSDTWLWGWDNVNDFSPSILTLAEEIRQKGKLWDLSPLITAQFELTDIFDGHSLSVVTCGVSNQKLCYYAAPLFDELTSFVAFSGVPKSVFAPILLLDFVEISLECLAKFAVDHKIFIESFLLWNKTPYEWRGGNAIIAHFDMDLKIEFETHEDSLIVSDMVTL